MTRGSKSKKKEKHLLKLFADGKQPDWFDYVETLFKPHVKVWTPHVEVTNWQVALQFIKGGLDPHEIFSNRTCNLRHGGSTEVEQEAFLWAVDSGLRCAVLHFLRHQRTRKILPQVLHKGIRSAVRNLYPGILQALLGYINKCDLSPDLFSLALLMKEIEWRSRFNVLKKLLTTGLRPTDEDYILNLLDRRQSEIALELMKEGYPVDTNGFFRHLHRAYFDDQANLANYIFETRNIDINEVAKHYKGTSSGIWKLFIENGVDKSTVDIGTRFTKSKLDYAYNRKKVDRVVHTLLKEGFRVDLNKIFEEERLKWWGRKEKTMPESYLRTYLNEAIQETGRQEDAIREFFGDTASEELVQEICAFMFDGRGMKKYRLDLNFMKLRAERAKRREEKKAARQRKRAMEFDAILQDYEQHEAQYESQKYDAFVSTAYVDPEKSTNVPKHGPGSAKGSWAFMATKREERNKDFWDNVEVSFPDPNSVCDKPNEKNWKGDPARLDHGRQNQKQIPAHEKEEELPTGYHKISTERMDCQAPPIVSHSATCVPPPTSDEQNFQSSMLPSAKMNFSQVDQNWQQNQRDWKQQQDFSHLYGKMEPASNVSSNTSLPSRRAKKFVPNLDAKEFVPSIKAKEFVPNVQAKEFVPNIHAKEFVPSIQTTGFVLNSKAQDFVLNYNQYQQHQRQTQQNWQTHPQRNSQQPYKKMDPQRNSQLYQRQTQQNWKQYSKQPRTDMTKTNFANSVTGQKRRASSRNNRGIRHQYSPENVDRQGSKSYNTSTRSTQLDDFIQCSFPKNSYEIREEPDPNYNSYFDSSDDSQEELC